MECDQVAVQTMIQIMGIDFLISRYFTVGLALSLTGQQMTKTEEGAFRETRMNQRGSLEPLLGLKFVREVGQ